MAEAKQDVKKFLYLFALFLRFSQYVGLEEVKRVKLEFRNQNARCAIAAENGDWHR